MKKFFGILCVMFAFIATSISAQDVVTCWPPHHDPDPTPAPVASPNAPVKFNFTMTVDKYIETTASPINFDFGITEHKDGAESLITSNVGEWNLAYANCPFSVSITGDNDAHQGVPRFVRQEVGPHAGGFDVLPTFFNINFLTNGVSDPIVPGWVAAENFPLSKNYVEAPHNGQVKMTIATQVNYKAEKSVPVRKCNIDPSFKYQDSADAGQYGCNMVVTFAAL